MTFNDLYEKYPDLFQQRSLDSTKTNMCWGILTGEGWIDLIDRMCQELMEKHPWVEFTQIKEKFGQLRVYIAPSQVTLPEYDAARKLIGRYEAESDSICEQCGAPGKLNRERGWIRVECEEHWTNEDNDPED